MMTKRIIAALCLLPCLAFGQGAYSSKITFSGYDKTETLTNFPVLVVFTNNAPSGFAYSQMTSTNGYDLRFQNETNAVLNYEIESWNTNAASFVWVRIPTLTNTGWITAYWGGDASQQTYTTNGATWDSGAVGVWHLAITGGVLSAIDSVTNPANGVVTNSTTTNGVVDGGVGSEIAAGVINCGNATKAKIADSITLSAWIYPSGFVENYARIIDKHASDVTGYMLYMNRTNGTSGGIGIRFAINDAVYPTTFWDTDVVTIQSNNWWHVAATLDSSKLVKMYINGVQNTTNVFSYSLLTGDAPLCIGNRTSLGRTFIGKLDEIRVDNVTRSSNWVWACWLNQASNTTFQSYGAVSASASPWSLYRPNQIFRPNQAIKNAAGGQ